MSLGKKLFDGQMGSQGIEEASRPHPILSVHLQLPRVGSF
jgi:hypothetical protein